MHPRPPISDLDLIRIVQVAVSTLSVWLVFLLGIELFDRRSALFGAAIFAFLPELVGFSHLLWSETLFIALNLGWSLLLLRGVRREHMGSMLAAGALLALAALTRQVVASFLVLALVWLFVVRSSPWRGTARLGAAMLLGALVVFTPWTIRNAVVHGVFAPVAPRSGLALLHGAVDNLGGELGWTGIFAPETAIDEHAGAMAREKIAADPAAYVKRIFTRNVPRLWSADSYVLRHVQGPTPAQPRLVGYPPSPVWLERSLIVIFVGTYIALLVLAVIGAARAPSWRVTGLTVALVLHATALHGLLGANARHRVYLLAFAALYAGYALARSRSEWVAPLTTRRLAFLATSLLLLVLAIAGAPYARLVGQWVGAG